MFVEQLLRVWKCRPRRAVCRHCGAAIVWVITERGKNLPLTPGYAVVREDTDPTTGAVYELVHRDAVHFATCTRRQRKRRPPKRWMPRRPLLEIAARG